MIFTFTLTKNSYLKIFFATVTTVLLCAACNLKKTDVNNTSGIQVPRKSLGLLNNANLNTTNPANSNQANNQVNNQAVTNSTNNQPQANANSQAPLTGEWEIGFLVQDKTFKSKLNLVQNGNSFSGTGFDEETNANFNIINGQINPDSSVVFDKQYNNPTDPVVKYTGKFEMVNDQYYQGPYLSGEYLAQANNQSMSGIWQAEMVNPPPASQPPPANSNQGAPAANTANNGASPNSQPPSDNQNSAQGQINKNEDTVPSHPPDLSGKWEAGYESNFKTIHTTLFLEQYNDSLKGHGLDTSTNEAFDVEKGWYYFPKVTLVWKYTKGKGAAQTRTMIVKASVSMINEKDYQGPYLNGKTQGGGRFEAQLVK